MKASNIKWAGYYWILRNGWEIAKVDLINIKGVNVKQVSFCGEVPSVIRDDWEVKPIKDEKHS